MDKKITLIKSLTLFSALFCALNFGFGQEIASFNSAQNSACSGVVYSDPNITATGICRGSGITENISGLTYNSNNWTTNATLDTNDYLEWTLTPNAGYLMDLTTMYIRYDRSATGPTMVDIQVDSGSGFSSIFTDSAVNVNGENVTIDLSSFTTVLGTLTFRLYAYNASASGGTFDIEAYSAPTRGIRIVGTASVAPPCPTTTTWTAGAWDNGTPTTSTNVVINDIYDTATPGNGSFSACTLQVNATGNLIVNNGDFVEVENNVVVDGTIYVDTQGNFVQSDSGATFTLNVGGTASVHKVTAIKNDWFYYTYWSSPVEDETVDGAFPNTDTDRRFRYEAANYIDRGDGIDDNGNDWQRVAGSDQLIPGVGYAATASPFHIPGATDIADFNGAFNTGDISTSIFNNPVNAYSWNFIGNPYPGAIDFDAFYAANSAVVDGAAYFWSQASDPNAGNPGNQNSNFSQNDYATYTVVSGGAAGGGPNIPTQYVPSAQGFFIAGLANGDATFTNSMRSIVANSNDQFFKNLNSKGKTTSAANRLWINLTSDNGVFGQVLIAYVNGGTDGDDGLAYDAPKLSPNGKFAILYTNMDGSNKKFAIQGKSPSSLTEDEVIKLGFNTSIDVPTIYTLSIAQMQGDFLTGSPIYLKDNLLNKLHDLTTCDYTFTSEVGEFKDRFDIVFTSKTLSTDVFDLDDSAVSIFQIDDTHVRFKAAKNLTIKTIDVFDVLGRQLYQLVGNNNEETYNLSNLNNSIFIAKVKLSNGAVITKKAIKK